MSDKIIQAMTTKELVAVHNKMARAQVTKFKDRKTAETRVHSLFIMMGADKFYAALKKAKINPELITQYEAEQATEKAKTPKEKPQKQATEPEKAPVVPEIETDQPKEPSAPKGIVLNEASKAHYEAKKQAREDKKKKQAEARADKKKLDPESKAAAILQHVQKLMAIQLKNKETDCTTSTEIARSATTNTKVVCKQLKILSDLKLVEIEDDTTADGEEFFYVTLTKKGQEYQFASSEAPALGKEAKIKTVKLPGAAPGPRSSKAGKKIYKLVKDNPRREGTAGHKSFALIRNGMSYEEYIEAGGRATDLQWDIDHSFTELK